MKQEEEQQLDEIVAHLRNAPVPKMPEPAELVEPSQPRGRLWYIIPACSVAASLIGVIAWSSIQHTPNDVKPRDTAQQSQRDSFESTTIVLDVDLEAPLDRLEMGLDVIDEEIAELRERAVMLDARRRAEEMLALD